MTDDVSKPKKVMPKGGRKGGALFPRYSLEESVEWAKKLVSKTYQSPQPRAVIYSGVVGSGSGSGDIKMSAIKQFGFLDGKEPSYTATDFSKKIQSCPEDEVAALYREAALKPRAFSALYNTFQGDSVSKAKLKQRASGLDVHPDEVDRCVQNYISAMVFSGLAKSDGDKVDHIKAEDILVINEFSGNDNSEENMNNHTNNDERNSETISENMENTGESKLKAVFNVTVNLDSSLDTEKLENQLKLLRKYGAI